MLKNNALFSILFIIISITLISFVDLHSFSGRVRNVLSNIDVFNNYESIVRIDNIKNQPNTSPTDKAVLTFVQANLYRRINYPKKSEETFNQIIQSNCHIFKDYSILLLSEEYIRRRRYSDARRLLRQGLQMENSNLKIEFYIKHNHVLNLLREEVPVSYFKEAIETIKGNEFFSNEYSRYLPEFLFNIASAYQKSNNLTQALKYYTKVIFNHENTNFALRSAREIDRLLENNRWLRSHANAETHRKMVEIYIKNRYYNTALIFLRKLRPSRENYLFMVDCHLYRGEFDDAMAMLRQVTRNRESFLKFAKLLKFRGQLRNSKSALIRNIFNEDIYDEITEEALILMIEILLEEKAYEEAQKYYVKLSENYPANGYHSKILWVFGKGYFSNKRYAEAEKYFLKLQSHLSNASHDERARAVYWYALSIEKQGRYVQSANIYNQLIRDYVFSFYAYRSLEKINYCFNHLNENYSHLTSNEKRELHTLQQSLRTYYLDLRRQRSSVSRISTSSGNEFRRFYEHNVNEIDRFTYLNRNLMDTFVKYYVLKQLGVLNYSILELRNLHFVTGDDNLEYNLALLHTRNSQNNRAIRIIENLIFNSTEYEFNINYFPNELREILYPMNSYRTIIERYAQYYDINPLLVRAIIREESRFYYRGRSSAGAIGLMQIIPSTGRWIANQLGYRNFRPSNLYQPSLNIRFGTFYFHNLMEKYDRNIVKSLAAYNGGRGNVDNWLRNIANDDIDYFIENIPFNETRRYVKTVLRSFYLYSLMNNGLSDFEVTMNLTNSSNRNFWE